MSYLLPVTVFLLMLSIGMSLRIGKVIATWRTLRWTEWLRLVFATFIAPPAIALFGARIFHLSMPETAGLFMVGVAPGAPLLTRNLSRKRFDMHVAASYQLWVALMVPIMLPILVLCAGKLYNREIWIPPHRVLAQIAENQFLPLAIGMLITAALPGLAKRIHPWVQGFGNGLFLVVLIAVLIKLGSALRSVTPAVPIVALMIALTSMVVMRLFSISPRVRHAFALCNVNRHVGLALLLAGDYLHARGALPAVACYALIAPVLMAIYVRVYGARDEASSMTAAA